MSLTGTSAHTGASSVSTLSTSSSSISPSSSRSVPSSSAQIPSATPSSIRSVSDPHSATSRTYDGTSTLPATTTSSSRWTEEATSSSSTSASVSSSATSSGSASRSPTSTSIMSSSSSSAPSTHTVLSTTTPSPASTTPGSTSHGSTSPSTITSITSSATVTSTPIQSTSSIEPELEPEGGMSSNPDGTPFYNPTIIHKLVLDSGTCTSQGKPKVVPVTSHEARTLESLGDGRYTTALDINDWPSREVNIWLEDDGERCGSQGTCTMITASFDAEEGLKLSTARSGDRSFEMYPFSVWIEGGQQWDGTPADSEANKYNCWGWSKRNCPFAHIRGSDPAYSLMSTAPNATAYITFCPPDGPAASEITTNLHPDRTGPGPELTVIVLPTESTVPTGTFLQVITTTTNQSHPMIIPETDPAPTSTRIQSGAAAAPVLTPAPTATEDDGPIRQDCDPNDTTTTCIMMNTFAPIEETSTILISKFFASILMTTSNGVVEPISTAELTADPTTLNVFTTLVQLGSTTVVPITPTPTRPRGTPTVTSWFEMHTDSVRSTPVSVLQVSTLNAKGPSFVAVPTTVTDSLGSPVLTSTISAHVVPTLSVVTDSRGSALSTVSLDVTIPAPSPTVTPPPQLTVTLTSWTTWITVNGSTVPAIAGQVGVLTTVNVTYVLEPGTKIPVGDLSSISVESTRTSLPSVTAQAATEQTTQGNRASKIAGAIVGTLVGLTLLGVLLWVVCMKRRRRQRAPDYAAARSPIWGPSGGFGSADSSRSASQLDLDGGPQPRASFVEPWVDQTQSQGQSRKMQREMEEYGSGGVLAAGPSRRTTTGPSSSVGHAYDALRHSKSANRVPPELRPEPLSNWPMRNNTLSSIHSQGSSSGHNHLPAAPQSPPAPVPSLSAPVSPASAPTQPLPPLPAHRQYSQQPIEEEPRHNAIPPLYNEAWNIQPARSSE